jgi:rare lipoprotein A
MGTHVQVTNLRNGRSCRVRINDRGPFAHDRVIDLSFTAAEKLNIVGPGTAPITLVAVGQPAATGQNRPPIFQVGPLTVQIGSFIDRSNAEKLARRLNARYGPGQAVISLFNDGRTFFRVRVFHCQDRQDAEERLKRLARDGFGQGYIVAID